jgi:hypothetical protein
VTPCRIAGYQHCRPQLQSSPPWKPQISEVELLIKKNLIRRKYLYLTWNIDLSKIYGFWLKHLSAWLICNEIQVNNFCLFSVSCRQLCNTGFVCNKWTSRAVKCAKWQRARLDARCTTVLQSCFFVFVLLNVNVVIRWCSKVSDRDTLHAVSWLRKLPHGDSFRNETLLYMLHMTAGNLLTLAVSCHKHFQDD